MSDVVSAQEELSVRIHHGQKGIAELGAQWRRLATRTGAGYFQTWEWVSAWHDVLEPEARLVTFTVVDSSGELRALLPLANLRRSFHRRLPLSLPYIGLAGAGAGAGDHLGPLADGPESLSLVLSAAADATSGRTILFENLDSKHAEDLRIRFGARVVDRVRCPAADLEPGVDPYTQWTKKLRENVRRRDRQLAEQQIRGRWVGLAGEHSDALASLQKVHKQRWSGRGEDGLFDERRLSFLKRLAELAAPPEGPWLYLLETGDQTAAALLGFRFGSSFSSYKTGWDPAFARFGIGIALTTAAIRWSHENGLTRFDLLRGAEPHKYVFGMTDIVDTSLIRPNRGRGRLLSVREEISRRRAEEWTGRNAKT